MNDSLTSDNGDARHRWISVAAYYKAERRSFVPGRELDDWLAAEQEYIETLIRSFLIISTEDGGMTVSGLKRLAQDIGINEVDEHNLQADLVRAIQTASNSRPCFQSQFPGLCDDSGDCQWKSECKKMIAAWKR